MTSRRTHLLLSLALVLAISAVASPVASAADRAPSCKRAKSKTIDQNRLVRVYAASTADGRGLFACRRSTGRRVELENENGTDDDELSDSAFSNVRLAGRYVAWSSTTTDRSCKADCPPDFDATTERIRVYDTGRRRSRTVPGEPLGRALVLSDRGAVAWAARRESASTVDIHASVRAGDDRVIDSGSIDPRSLAIEITIISWTRDGIERFARLR